MQSRAHIVPVHAFAFPIGPYGNCHPLQGCCSDMPADSIARQVINLALSLGALDVAVDGLCCAPFQLDTLRSRHEAVGMRIGTVGVCSRLVEGFLRSVVCRVGGVAAEGVEVSVIDVGI